MTSTHHTEHHGHHHDHATPGADGEQSGHDKHAGHDPEMFRRLFWWNLLLAIPVLVFSEQIQNWFDYTIDVPGAALVAPLLGTVIYLWGGRPFLAGALAEVRSRQPGMMLLIALGVSGFVCNRVIRCGW